MQTINHKNTTCWRKYHWHWLLPQRRVASNVLLRKSSPQGHGSGNLSAFFPEQQQRLESSNCVTSTDQTPVITATDAATQEWCGLWLLQAQCNQSLSPCVWFTSQLYKNNDLFLVSHEGFPQSSYCLTCHLWEQISLMLKVRLQTAGRLLLILLTFITLCDDVCLWSQMSSGLGLQGF